MTKADDYNLNSDDCKEDCLLDTVIERLLSFIDLSIQKGTRSWRSDDYDVDDNSAFLKRRIQDENFVSEELFWADLIMFYQAMRRSAPDLSSQESEEVSEQTSEPNATASDLPDPESDEGIGSFIDYDWDELSREDQDKWRKRLATEANDDPAFAVPLAKVTLSYASNNVSLSLETKAYDRAQKALEELLEQSDDNGAPDWEAQSLLIEIELREIGAYVRRSLCPPQDVVKKSLGTIDRLLETCLEGEGVLSKARRSYANGRVAMLWGFEATAHAEFEESRRLLRTICEQDPSDEINYMRLAYVNITLASIQLSVGDRAAAISSCYEAMETLQNECVDSVCMIDLANCALQISEIKVNEGDKRQAEECLFQALEFIEKLYDRNPNAYALNYAYVLLNCATFFSGLEDNEQSLKIADRTIEIAEEILRNNEIPAPPWVKYDVARFAYQKRASFNQNMKQYDAALRDIEKALENTNERYSDFYGANLQISEACSACASLAIPVCEIAIAYDRGSDMDVVAQKLRDLIGELRDDEIAKFARSYFVLLMILYSHNGNCNREKKAFEYLEQAVSFAKRDGVAAEDRGDLLITRYRALHMRGRHFFYKSDPRALEDVESAETLVNEIHEVGGAIEELEAERFDNLMICACLYSELGRVQDSRKTILRAVLLLNDQFAQKRWDNLTLLARVVSLSLLWLEAYSTKLESLRVIKIWLRYINRLRIRFIEYWYSLHDEEEAVEKFDSMVSILDDATVTLRILRVRLLLKGEWSEELGKYLPIHGAGVTETQNPFVKSRFQSAGDDSALILSHMTRGQFFEKRASFIKTLEERNLASRESFDENVSLCKLGGSLAEVIWRDLNFCLRVFIGRAGASGNGNFKALFETMQKIVEIYWAHNEKTLAVAEVSLIANAFAPILVESDAVLQPFCKIGACVDEEALKEHFRQMNASFLEEKRRLSMQFADADQDPSWTSRLVAARNVFCYLGDLLSAGERNSWRIATFVDETDDALSDRVRQCFTKSVSNESENAFQLEAFSLNASALAERLNEPNGMNELDQFNSLLFQGVKIARPGERREFFELAERSYLLALCALGARVRENAVLIPHYVESLLSYSTLLFSKGRVQECADLWATTEKWFVPLLRGSKGRALELLLFFYHHYFDFVNDSLKDRAILEKIAATVLDLLTLDKPIDGERRAPLENHVIFLLDFAFVYNSSGDVANELRCLKGASEILLELCERSFNFHHYDTLISSLQYIFDKGEKEDRGLVARIFKRSERFFKRLSPSERNALTPTMWELSISMVRFYSEERRCFFLANHFATNAKTLSKRTCDFYLDDWNLGRIAVITLPRIEVLNQFYDSFNNFADNLVVNESVEPIVLRILNALDSGEERVSPSDQNRLLCICGSLLLRSAYLATVTSADESAKSTLELFDRLSQRLSDRTRNALAWIKSVADSSGKISYWPGSLLRRCKELFGMASCSFKDYREDRALEFNVISQYVIVRAQAIISRRDLNYRDSLSCVKRILSASRALFKFPNALELSLIYGLADHSYEVGRWNDVIQACRLFERRATSVDLPSEQRDVLGSCRRRMNLLYANALVNRNGAHDLDVAQRCFDSARSHIREEIGRKNFLVRDLLWLEFLGLAKLAHKHGRINEAKSYALRARHMEAWLRRFSRPFSLYHAYSDELDALLSALTSESDRSIPVDRNGENE